MLVINILLTKTMIKITIMILFFAMVHSAWGEGITRFELNISHTELDRTYNNKTMATQFNSITGLGTEQLSNNFSGSLILGYQEQLQDGNVIKAARYAIGYFGGIAVDYTVVQASKYKLTIPAKYQYHQLEGKDGNQTVNITWYDISLGVKNYYNLGTNTQLLADVYYFEESGNQRALAPLSQSIRFDNKSNITYSIGMAYFLKANSSLAFKWLQGSEQGFHLLFSSKI